MHHPDTTDPARRHGAPDPTERNTITNTTTNPHPAADPASDALHRQYLEALDRIRAAAATYYAGEPTMSDADYDDLLAFAVGFESDRPDLAVPDSPTGAVAAGAVGGGVEHVRPMLSLDNAFDAPDLNAWATGLDKRLGGRTARYLTVEPKLDGLSLAARYRGGELVQLLTRGSGTAGEDVSHIIGSVVGLPDRLPEPLDIEVRGEVIMTLDQFEQANAVRAAHGHRLFTKPRGAAAGTVRARDRDYLLPLSFYAFDVMRLDDPDRAFRDSHHSAMTALVDLGVNIALAAVPGETLFATIGTAAARIAEIAALRGELPFEIDGAVVKADAMADRRAAGEGSRVPHWAIAFKYPPVSKHTKLLNVVWAVGRTGLIAPTAELEPVTIDGAVVSRATLHHPSAITALDLRLGDTVSVVRAGDVIPRVEGPVPALRDGSELPIRFPSACPACGGELDTSGQRWRCARGRRCGLPAGIEYAVQRDVLDIDGFGPTLAKQLVASGAVADVADLFTLTRAQLLAVDRMGPLTADRLLENIAAAKAQPLSRVLCSLGIRFTGRRMSRRIARAYGSMRAIQAATAADLVARVEGIGAEKAPSIIAELAELAEVVAKMTAAGVTMTEPTAPAADGQTGGGPLAGQVVVVTGSMTGPLGALSRTGVNELIEAAGGKSSGSVGKATTLLVAGEKAGSKLDKARSLGTKILTCEEFAALVADYLT